MSSLGPISYIVSPIVISYRVGILFSCMNLGVEFPLRWTAKPVQHGRFGIDCGSKTAHKRLRFYFHFFSVFLFSILERREMALTSQNQCLPSHGVLTCTSCSVARTHFTSGPVSLHAAIKAMWVFLCTDGS